MLIGVVGLGSMGAPFARNLAVDGDRVLAYDIDPRALGAASGGPVEAANSIADLGRRCELVVTMVWDDVALRSVVLGDGGLLADSEFTGCIVDLSTTSLAIAREIGAACASRGAAFLDGAVIGGGVPAARAGSSPIVIAGDEPTFRRVSARLARLGACDYVGAQGNAKVAKIINNLLVGIVSAANAEALSLGVAAGAELADLVAWLGRSEGGSTVLASYMGRYLKDGTYGDGLIGHRLMAKDVGLACVLADEARFPSPLAELARQVYVTCGQTLGHEAAFPSTFDFFRTRAANSLRPVG